MYTIQYTHTNVIKITISQMADTSKDELLLGGGIRHLTATSHITRTVNKFVLAYVLLFKHINFPQYVVRLREEYLVAALC